MTDLRKAAVKALHALEDPNRDKHVANTADAINSLRQALAQPEQEPLVNLTDEEIADAVGSPIDEVYLADFRKVEAALRSKNT